MAYVNSDATNRLTLSARFGLNISARFHGVVNPFAKSSVFGFPRSTPDGNRYNYDNGYVLTDSTGNALGYTSNWGYDNASQVNAAGFPANTIEFDQTTAVGPAAGSSGNQVPPGIELTYDRQLSGGDCWCDLRYGMEGAVNYMKASMRSTSVGPATLMTTTTAFSYQSGDTPPAAPFQGTFGGFGYMLLQVPPTFPTTAGPTAFTPGATLTSHDEFDADIWGFRLGPYIEWPVTQRISVRASGGLAGGLVYGHESWRQTVTPPVGPAITTTGGGSTFGMLLGGYVSVNGTYQINDRWGVDAGAQFQDLGKFSPNFQGRIVDLDLSRSIFIEAGISYSF